MSAETKLLYFPEHTKSTASPLRRSSEPSILLSFSDYKLGKQRGQEQPIEQQAISQDRIELQEQQIRNQAERLINFGFHMELGKTAEEYLKAFLNIAEQLKSHRGKFTTPLVIERRVHLKRQHELTGIDEFFDSNKVKDVVQRSNIPDDSPYVIWIPTPRDLMQETLGESLSEATLAKGEIDCTQLEVTSFMIHHRNFFRPNRVKMTAMGSRFSDRLIPYVEERNGRAYLDAISKHDRTQKSIALLRGEEITFSLAA